MKILIRKSDDVVIYAQDDLQLGTQVHGDGWCDPNYNTETARIENADLPDNWTGGVWRYQNGVLAVADEAGYAQILAAKMERDARINAAATEAAREAAKVRRAAAVAAITVTTAAGNTFDGDEVSQGRMARAIITLQSTGTPTTIWVLHDNGVIEASAAELSEALALAGAAQSALWVLP